MTSKQYLAALRALQWSHRHTGMILGYDERTSLRYAHGQTRIPRTVAAWLHALTESQELLRYLEKA
jgi:hypothetical protein